jgi:hypothetical protein
MTLNPSTPDPSAAFVPLVMPSILGIAPNKQVECKLRGFSISLCIQEKYLSAESVLQSHLLPK